jgi:hypothetical protein
MSGETVISRRLICGGSKLKNSKQQAFNNAAESRGFNARFLESVVIQPQQGVGADDAYFSFHQRPRTMPIHF